MRVAPLVLLLVPLLLASNAAGQHSFAFRKKVKVTAPTRIDWLYPVIGSSPERPPEGLLPDYDSQRQRYDLFAPTRVNGPGPLPLIVFISFRDTPVGWDFCGPTCASHGVLYAEPYDAGNTTPIGERVRIVLDVLDDVRRRYPIDPDRTYLMGHSGGGFTASRIAMQIPEYFGGLLTSSAPPSVSVDRWFSGDRWQAIRLRDRLSVAMHAGRKEPAGPTVGLVTGPLFERAGIRTAYQVHRKLGHAMPPPASIELSYQWLEGGLPDRRAAARRLPASRVSGSPSRREWASAFLAEAKQRLVDPKQTGDGVAQLRALVRRWPDLAEADQAKVLLSELESKEDRAWEADAARESLEAWRFLAEQYEAAATSQSPGLTKASRAAMAHRALLYWHRVFEQTDDPALIAAGEERLPLLEKLTANVPVRDQARLPPAIARAKRSDHAVAPLPGIRFSRLRGTFSLDEVIKMLSQQPGQVEFQIDEEAIRKARLTTRRRVSLDLRDATAAEVLTTILDPLKLTFDFDGRVATIRPAAKQ